MAVQRGGQQMAHPYHFHAGDNLVAVQDLQSIPVSQKQKERIEKMKRYIIKKGRHYPVGLHFKYHKGGDLAIFGKFDITCWHYPSDILYPGKNKLTGVTWGFRGVHINSIRIAWQPDKQHNIINLFVYYYNNGKKHIDPIGSVLIGQQFFIRILLFKDSFKVKFRNFEKKYAFLFPKTIIRYFNFPYFGGKSKAPWNIRIFLYT
jgi:hypothetical protein